MASVSAIDPSHTTAHQSYLHSYSTVITSRHRMPHAARTADPCHSAGCPSTTYRHHKSTSSTLRNTQWRSCLQDDKRAAHSDHTGRFLRTDKKTSAQARTSWRDFKTSSVITSHQAPRDAIMSSGRRQGEMTGEMKRCRLWCCGCCLICHTRDLLCHIFARRNHLTSCVSSFSRERTREIAAFT